ncbi:hypothetical protein BC830DRAFT_1104866 [Chytriomyces sp. MP71]|nr:hypothetical protein BC830DRAFT_1104866 [Chytriomyces sp. MP71]
MPVEIVRPSKFFRSSLGDLTPNNAGQLRVLLEHAMPAGFTSDVPALVKDAVATEDLCRLAYFNDMPVGAVVCAKEVEAVPINANLSKKANAANQANPPHTIVVKALCVLEPYRKLGLATRLLESVLETTNEKTKAVVLLEVTGVDAGVVASVVTKNGFEKEGAGWIKKLN